MCSHAWLVQNIFSASDIVQIGFKLLADSRGGPGADLGLPVGRKAQIFQKKTTWN